MAQIRVDVVIPTYKPDEKFLKLIERLEKQTIKPNKIIIMNTEEKYLSNLLYGTTFREKYTNTEIRNISSWEFNHGKTRNEGAKRSDAGILIFMTQDAIPENEHLIEELIRPMIDPDVAVTYARQLPTEDCALIERFGRGFNYPDQDMIKQSTDLKKLGIKTYFCSNVCAAYKRNVFDELEGFPRFVIFNEDMVFASKVIKAGKKIYYASKARILHSHNYSGKQQFKRNFDLGVSQADYPDIFLAVPSEGEGIKLVKETIKYLKEHKKIFKIPYLLYISGCKFLGYKLGLHYKKLSSKMILKCSSSSVYWERYWDKMKIPQDVHKGYGKNEEGL